MAFLVALLSIIMVLIGAYGLASPGGLVSFTQMWKGQRGVWMGAAIRIAFGVSLWGAAPTSHTPKVFQVFGVISLLSGILLPFIGAERLSQLISWWSRLGSTIIRGWSALAIALGVFFFWSIAT